MQLLVSGTTRAAVTDILKLVFGRYSLRRKLVLGMAGKDTQSMSTSGKDRKVLTLIDGRISFRARKAVHASSVKQPFEAARSSDLSEGSLEHFEVEISGASSVSLPTIKTDTIACDATTGTILTRRGAYSRKSVESSTSFSEVRRVSRKKKALSTPTPLTSGEVSGFAGDVPKVSASDFWHSSLSGHTGVVVDHVGIDSTVALIVPRRTMLASEDLAAAVEHLKCADPRLRTVIEMHEGPKFEKCSSAFTALVRSIVFQQLATKAASAIFGRVVLLCGGLENLRPVTISELSKEQLRAVGISERKASYLHDLAGHFLSGSLSDVSINEMDDTDLMKALTAVKGIGVWSVHMFMLFSLHKPDVLPVGDLGVRKGFQKLYELKALPSPAEMEKLSLCWQPYRSIGSWYMWRVLDMILPF